MIVFKSDDSDFTRRQKAEEIRKIEKAKAQASIVIAKIEKEKAVNVAWAGKAVPVATIAGLTLIICTLIVCVKIG